MMKAIVYKKFGPPDVLQLKEVAKPVPGDNELLIRICATTVSAVDSFYRKGDPFIARLDAGLFRPKKTTLGTDLAGIVETVGRNVTQFKVGDQIFGSSDSNAGTHAEYICLPENGALALKPANTTFEEAAAIPYGALTALHFLRDATKVRPGQKVLIYGASGSIGTLAVQLADHFGAEVTGVCRSTNFELVRSLGAKELIDYTTTDFWQHGQTYDVLFDTVGKLTFNKCKRALKQEGIYLTTVPSLPILLQMLWTSKIGSKKAKVAFAGLQSSGKKAEDLGQLRELIETGAIKPVIDRVYSLEQIAEAHGYVDKGHKRGNVVISISHSDLERGEL